MNPRILVAEDEADIADLLAYNFTAAGYEVRTANDGPTAISEAVNWLPQAIILDLNLPFLDGLSVCEILRHNTLTEHVPILMLTAWTGTEARELGLAAGANAYLTKPFSPQDVVKRVGQLIDRQSVVPVAA